MNSIWNENLKNFKERFPSLYETFFNTQDFTPAFQTEQAKNGEITASICENSQVQLLHSKYNPSREASQTLASFKADTHKAAIFLSFGLGYGPLQAAVSSQIDSSIPLILIEKDANYFKHALSLVDFTPLFKRQNLILLIDAPLEDVQSLLSKYTDKNAFVYSVPSQALHCHTYHAKIKEMLIQNGQKENINTNTLEKFSNLWLKNSLKNLNYMETLHGIQKYTLNNNLGKDIPFVILAAGPSLDSILPYLKEINKRSITVCVDTALHACLRKGVEPDFIILMDPQYQCAMHLKFLSSPSSVLITEIAAWPSVFRFNCKEKVLCSSLFPIGQYFESKLGAKGKLGAGGSVTTSAWDFARICGAKEIYLAGMDLGFPNKETHIRGSQFEENAVIQSDKTNSVETKGTSALISANPQILKDYNGNNILTDSRMKLFSWWFEQSTKTALLDGQKTYTLTPESLAIKNIEPLNIQEFLKKEPLNEKKEQFFATAESNQKFLQQQSNTNCSFKEILTQFTQDLNTLKELSKKGLNLCKKALENPLKINEINSELQNIDNKILNSSVKDAASLVFPTQRQLENLSSTIPQDPKYKGIYLSQLIYTELQKSINKFLNIL